MKVYLVEYDNNETYDQHEHGVLAVAASLEAATHLIVEVAASLEEATNLIERDDPLRDTLNSAYQLAPAGVLE